MADIARLAGVSMSTVSRALTGSTEIGAETRDRIVELARNLNYAVNVGARNLRRRENRTIAVVAPFLATDSQRLTDPFLWGLIGSIAESLTERGYQMLLSRIDVARVDVADLVESGVAAGVILTGQWLPPAKANELAVAGIPFAMWGAQGPQQLYCTVGTDNREGARLAVEHLFAQGARRIAFVGDVGTEEIRLRHEGYLAAHEARGVAPDPRLFLPSMFDTAAVNRHITTLVTERIAFDGVFASGDLAAIETIRDLIQAGRRVPEDVAVVGYDDIPAAALVTPGLTTVRQPIDLAGRELVDALLAQLAGHPPASRVLPTELIKRGSTR